MVIILNVILTLLVSSNVKHKSCFFFKQDSITFSLFNSTCCVYISTVKHPDLKQV